MILFNSCKFSISKPLYKYPYAKLYKSINCKSLQIFSYNSGQRVSYTGGVGTFLNKSYNNEFFNRCIVKLSINRKLKYNFIKNGILNTRLHYLNNPIFKN